MAHISHLMKQAAAGDLSDVTLAADAQQSTANKVLPLYSTINDTTPSRYVGFDDLAAMCEQPSVKEKLLAPALTPFYADNKRKTATREASYHAIVQDHDHDNLIINEIRVKYNQYRAAFLAFASSSHQQEKGGITANRWKVVIPLAEPVCLERYTALAVGMTLLNGTDEAQIRSQQVFFAPNKISHDAPFDHINMLDREPLNGNDDDHFLVKACLEKFDEYQRAQAAKAEVAKPKPRSIAHIPDGEGIIGKMVSQFNISDELRLNGCRKIGEAYLSPNSSTGTPGIVILERDGKEVCYSHHGATDPLSNLNNNGHSLDVVDVKAAFEFGGDMAACIAHYAPLVDPDGQKQRQREHMAEQDRQREERLRAKEDEEVAALANGQPFDLSIFSLKGQAAEMEAKMLDDSFVLEDMAIMGQITCFYAKPNAGKTLMTLKLLVDSVQRGDIKASDVYYINADDNYKGLVTKLKIAEKYGFHMLAPGHGQVRFDSSAFVGYLRKMMEDGTADGKVIILDTLKKFMDLMDKQAGTSFLKVVREFASHNGTVIMLAHTNKHRDGDGKLIFAGTSDVVDDIDCAYMIDALEGSAQGDSRTVVFENFKSRGDVAAKVTYGYQIVKGQSYIDLMNSVCKVSDGDAQEAARRDAIKRKLEANSEIIDVILEAIGTTNAKVTKSTLLDAAKEAGIPRQKANKVIREHTGTVFAEGHRWRVEKGEKNTHLYSRIISLDDAYISPEDEW